MINLNNIPSEPKVTVLNPDGSELITTNNVTTFTFIRLEIVRNKLNGYKVRDEAGNIYDMRPDGKILDKYHRWPDNLTGEVYGELLWEMI